MKKQKVRWNNILVFLIMLACIILLIIKIIYIVQWKLDSHNINKQIEKIETIVNINEIRDTDDTEIIAQEEKIEEENPYWDYIKMSLIDVEFQDLMKINKDVKGWIQVNGTNINYPFVQTNDNKYYLTHSFNQSYNKSGWVFLDYRNNGSNNKNTILYAHSRTDNTMFGSLKNILSNGWLDNSNNYVIKLSTPLENTLWQVFSIYHIPTTNDYLQTEFISDDHFFKFVDMLKRRSVYNFNIPINKKDQILTLSTCYNDNERLVLHAKLVKRALR